MKTRVINDKIDDWDALPWKTWQQDVSRLQERIAQAATNEDRRELHRIQRMMLHSFAAKCIAVKRVAQVNRGRHTAGADGIKSLSKVQCLKLAKSLDLKPTRDTIRRVWIDKPGKAEKRPLSIPTMRDRAQQMLVKMALEPEWEPRFEPNSYGFRPRRSTADAMVAVFNGIVRCPTGKYVLDADIRSCFDRINHQALLRKLSTISPIRQLITAWLKAGILDGEQLQRAKEGVPQGGVISPLLANIALHGLEQCVTQCVSGQTVVNGKSAFYPPILIRYADDFVVLHPDKDTILQCRAAAETFIGQLGLELSPDKTSIKHSLNDMGEGPGFQFLGFHFRSFPVSPRFKRNGRTCFKTLVTPSDKAVKKHYQNLCDIVEQCGALDQATLICRLNPVIRGWANYYRAANSAKTFSKVDQMLYLKLRQWCHRRHARKSKGWIVNKYWNRGRPWKFMDTKTGNCLLKHSEVHVARHTKVRGCSHPFDRNRVYWNSREKQNKRPVSGNAVTKLPSIQAEKPHAAPLEVDLWR